MALEPVKGYLMPFEQFSHAFPQVAVLYGFFCRSDPAPGNPALQPAVPNGFRDILGVCVQIDAAGFRQQLKSAQNRDDLHAIICGRGKAAGNFLPVLAETQHRRPAARAGVAEAGPVGMNFNLFHAKSILSCFKVSGGVCPVRPASVAGRKAAHRCGHKGQDPVPVHAADRVALLRRQELLPPEEEVKQPRRFLLRKHL